MDKKTKSINKKVKQLPSLSKDRFIRLLQKSTGLNYEVVRTVTEEILDLIIEDLIRGEKVKIRNFIELQLLQLKPKKIRNIHTGQVEVVDRANQLKVSLDKRFSWFLSKLVK